MSRVSWVRTPPGVAALRPRDHALGVLIGWLVPGAAAWGARRLGGPILVEPRWLAERLGEHVAGVTVGTLYGAASFGLPVLATLGPGTLVILRSARLGGPLPMITATAVPGCLVLEFISWRPYSGTDPFGGAGDTSAGDIFSQWHGLLTLGDAPGAISAAAYWLALRLLRPAAFGALQ